MGTQDLLYNKYREGFSYGLGKDFYSKQYSLRSYKGDLIRSYSKSFVSHRKFRGKVVDGNQLRNSERIKEGIRY